MRSNALRWTQIDAICSKWNGEKMDVENFSCGDVQGPFEELKGGKKEEKHLPCFLSNQTP